MSVQTRSQKLAREAFARIEAYVQARKLSKDYTTFAKKFPALVHSCGLAQAVAFAHAKGASDYLADLAAVLTAGGHQSVANPAELAKLTRECAAAAYLRLTRDTLDAAVWLKRYVEAAAVAAPKPEAQADA